MRTDHTEEQFNPNDPGFIAGRRDYEARTIIRDMIDAGEADRLREIMQEEIERRARH